MSSLPIVVQCLRDRVASLIPKDYECLALRSYGDYFHISISDGIYGSYPKIAISIKDDHLSVGVHPNGIGDLSNNTETILLETELCDPSSLDKLDSAVLKAVSLIARRF